MINFFPIQKDEVIEKISYSYFETSFGKIIIACTNIGICYAAFYEDESEALADLNKYFPNINKFLQDHALLQIAQQCLINNKTFQSQLPLHVKGSPFQLLVWQWLLQIPFGTQTTYQTLAKKLTMPNAARAVGSALAKNPIAYFIPCHRVISSSGKLNGYRWGLKQKALLLDHESDKQSRLF